MKFRKRTRAPLAVLAAGATLVGLVQATAWAGPAPRLAPAPTSSMVKTDPSQVPPGDRATRLGENWQKSGDLAWITTGDATGFHLLTAREDEGYTWKTSASLSEPGFDADQWIGNACVTGSGKRAVVVYAPRTFTNKPKLMARGGFTAVVDLSTGEVTKLDLQASLSYYNPGCGLDESAVLTQSGGEDRPGTRLIRLNATTGKLSEPITTKGQVTSAVPTDSGAIVAASGAQVIQVGPQGKHTVLARTDGVPYRLSPDGNGGVVFLDKRGDTAKVKRITRLAMSHPDAVATRPAVLAQGPVTETGLTRSAGTVYVTGKAEPTPVAAELPDVVRRLSGAPKDAIVTTRGAAVLTPATWGDGKGSLLMPGEETKSRPVKLTMTVRRTNRNVSFTVNPAKRLSKHASQGHQAAPGLLAAPQTKGKLARAATASSPSDPVEDERTCSVPRNDPRNQAMQPKPRQVEWAVDQAVTGFLNTHVQRAANWKNLGMPSYSPQELFLNPAVDGGGRVPAQIMLGVTAQESNMWQAGREAVPGVTGNPLIGNYYGIDLYDGDSSNDWEINFAEADCGYGITQITDHMRMAGREDGHGGAAWDYQKQRAAALDYTANISAGLQTLVSKWNETRAAGLVVNQGTPGRPENWFFALWAYNSGFHPNLGDGSPWGLGWTNNPANPEWDAGRTPFMENAAGGEDASAAAHPQNWPYPEKVIGFAAHPPSFLESPGTMVPAFRAATWNGTNSGVTVKGSALYNRAHAKPPESMFCDASISCDPSRISDGASNDTGATGPCGRDDFQCWWNKPVTWKDDCVDTCGFEFMRFNSTYPEEADGTAYPPSCTTSGLPAGALIIDDVPQGTPVVRPGCTNSWTNSGTFSFKFGNNGSESVYPSKVDLHQLGAGFGGHFYFGHTRISDDKGQRLKIEGKWRLGAPLKSQAKVMVHLPDHGAQTDFATYEIDTEYGVERRTISQAGNANRWVSLGAFRFDNTPEVRLNTVASNGTGDEDIAFDAVAVVPGSYDLIPDIRLPDEDPASPEPADDTPIMTVPGDLFPRPASLVGERKIAETSKCQPVKGHAKRRICFDFGNHASSKSPRMTPNLLAGETLFCSRNNAEKFLTRTVACLQDEFSAEVRDDGVVVGRSVFAYKHQLDLDIASAKISETVEISPTTADPKVPLVTANIKSFCQPTCTSAALVWSSPAAWGPGDSHTARGTVEHSWTGTSGHSEGMHLNWIIDLTIQGGNPTSTGYEVAGGKMDVRCDLEAKNTKGKPGCVFPSYTPTYVVNTWKNPSAGAFYWILQQKLPSHPGSRDHNEPLTYNSNNLQADSNRAIICPRSGPEVFIPNPASNAPTRAANCDEYPFATTYQSGGMPPQQVRSGRDCTQLYAVAPQSGSSGWTLREDPTYSRVNTWQEICGRASIPGDENSGAAQQIGLRFVPSNRMIDKDNFYVAVPGFEECVDLSQICWVRPRG